VALSLSDALQIPILKTAKILTDPAIIAHRRVSSASVIEVPVGTFVRPGEFVMTTGMGVGKKPAQFESVVKEIAAGGACALAIAIGPHTPQVPKRAINAANRLKLPLIELPWAVRFSEVTEALLRRIIQEAGRVMQRDEFVWSLISHNIAEQDAVAQADRLGFEINTRCVAVVAKAEQTRFVESLCATHAAKNRLSWIGAVFADRVVGYLETPRTKQRLASIIDAIQTAAADECVTSWGIGRTCNGFADLGLSYEDARAACEIGTLTRGEGSITDVSDILADHLLLNLWNDAKTQTLVARYIEPLKRFQRIPLLATLEALADSDWNASNAARTLSISRQSMLYRLEKIESLLNVDLHHPDQRFAMLLSLRIHRLERLLKR
jgi:DNA-binding PucR family transcriptional regulator